MRTTVDISDEVYAQLKSKAALEHTSVKALISVAVSPLLSSKSVGKRRLKHLPVIGSSAPGTLKITNEQLYDLISFP